MKFAAAYVKAAMWSSTDAAGNPLDDSRTSSDIGPVTVVVMRADCERFQAENSELLSASGLTEEQAGFYFWLTRNGHGAGFWDQDLGEIGEKQLSAAAKAFGSFDLYVGDDGYIHGN